MCNTVHIRRYHVKTGLLKQAGPGFQYTQGHFKISIISTHAKILYIERIQGHIYLCANYFAKCATNWFYYMNNRISTYGCLNLAKLFGDIPVGVTFLAYSRGLITDPPGHN